ncbi:hypothetical protein P3L10_010604 [Capsicum annuum]
MNKGLQNGESFHFKVTKNKSIAVAKLISLMKGNRMNNQQKVKCALVWFLHAMLLAKDPSKKVNSEHIKMTADLEFFRGYPWGKMSFKLTLSYLKMKTDLTKQKEAFVKRNNASYMLFGFPWAFLVWIYEAFPHLERYVGKSLDSLLPIPCLLRWHTSKCDKIMESDPFKYTKNNTKIVHPYLTPTVCEMEQRCIKNFKPYTDKVKDTKGHGEDKGLSGHHYVLSPPRACDHTGSSGHKNSPDASNNDDLRERIALLKKILLDIAFFIRDERLLRIEKDKKKKQKEVYLDNPLLSWHQVNLEELAVAVTNMAVADEKGKEETEEENATDQEEKEIDEEMTAEAEEENKEKTKEDGEKKSKEEEDKNEDGEKKSKEEEDKNEKAVKEESVVEQEVENIEEEKK